MMNTCTQSKHEDSSVITFHGSWEMGKTDWAKYWVTKQHEEADADEDGDDETLQAKRTKMMSGVGALCLAILPLILILNR